MLLILVSFTTIYNILYLPGPNIFALHYRDVTDDMLPTVKPWLPAQGGGLVIFFTPRCDDKIFN